MKAGLDLRTNKVVLDLTNNGITFTADMTANAARMLAAQLVASAETLDQANENGWTEDADA